MNHQQLEQRSRSLEQANDRLRFTLSNREREIGRLKEQRAGYEEALALAEALLAVLCARAPGGTLRLEKAAVRTALEDYVCTAAADETAYCLSVGLREESE